MLKKIYAASAGTGKTTQIINDFVNEINNLEDLKAKLKTTVFITFSNSAADEIKSKLYKKIKELKSKLDKDEMKSTTDIIEFNVYTIHSFCLRVIKFLRHYYYLPLDIDFFPSDEKNEITLWSTCVDEYFENLTNEDEIQKFFKLVNIDNCKNFLKRYGFLIFAMDELRFTQTENYQQSQIDENSVENNGIKLKDIIENCEDEERPFNEVFQELERQNLTKNDLDNYLNYLKIKGKEIFNEIVKKIYYEIYLKKIHIEGIMDYDTSVFLVCKGIKQMNVKNFFDLLKESGWEIKEIYVDEAQDNDVIQNYFVVMLAKTIQQTESEPTITIVGDYKQSIYQWRDAHPEEFNKIIEEAGNNVVERLKKSYRIYNENSLKYINSVFDRINKNKIGRNWFYSSEDKLEFNEDYRNHPDNTSSALIKMFILRKEQNHPIPIPQNFQIEQNNQFIEWLQEKGKKVGILVRSRSDLKYLNEILDSINVRYRIQDVTTIEGLKDDKDNFYPEYMLVRPLFLLFDYKKRYLLCYFLLLTFPGRILLEKIVNNFKDVKDFKDLNDLITDVSQLLIQLSEEYEYKKFVPAVYDILKEKNIWEIMTHHDDVQQTNKVIRQLNSLLGLIYLTEKRIKVLPKQKIFDIYFNSPFLPPEWFMLPEDIERNNENIIEVTTIHSAKGLTYDRVVIIADFWKDFLSDEPNFNKEKERYNFLFNIDFDRVLTEDRPVKVDFFPYIIMKYILKETENQNNLQDFFLIQLFKKLKTKIHNEKLNLLYVALTRTRKDIAMFTEPKNDGSIHEEVKNIFNNVEQICYDQEENNQKKNIEIKFRYKKIVHTFVPKVELYRIICISEQNKIIDSKKIKIDTWQKYQHIVVGKILHEIIRNFLQQKNVADINCVKDELVNDTKLKRMIDNIFKNSMNEINKITQIKTNFSDFRTEIPIWKTSCEDNINKFLHGIIDSFYVKDNVVYLYEYKTLFLESSNELSLEIEQKKQSYKEQIETYKRLLMDLFQVNKTNTIDDSFILFKYIREK